MHLLLACAAVDGVPETDTAPVDVACDDLVTAAESLLASLEPEQADAMTFALDDPNRAHWDNRPVPTVPRDGVAIGELSAAQADAAWSLLATSLSAVGYQQARDIVALDDYGVATDPNLGSQHYTFAIYGTPSREAPWAWQFDGHHLVYNFAVRCPAVAMAPNLLGANPTRVPDGELEGLEAMAAEIDSGFALYGSLDDAQMAKATLEEGTMVMGPGTGPSFPDEAGIPGSELSAEQQQLLLDLVEAWTEDQDVALWPVDPADLWFAWAGAASPDGPYYYRVSGLEIWIELDAVAGPDHVHGVLRDPLDDYGAQTLAAHRARWH